jgi:phasin family protein
MATEINPFGSIATMFEQFKTPSVVNPFVNMAKMFEQFKMPGVDMASMVEAQRKSVEALIEANRLAYQGIQAMVQKQTEMFTRVMQAMQAAAAATAGADPTRQAEIARRAFETVVADMRELAELARQSQSDAIAHMTDRANEHTQEFTKRMQPK